MHLLRRDIKLSFRGNSTGLTLGFFFIALTFIPFGLGPDLALLQKLAPGAALGCFMFVGFIIA